MEEIRKCVICGDEYIYKRSLGRKCLDCYKKAKIESKKKSLNKLHGEKPKKIVEKVQDVNKLKGTLKISAENCFRIQKMLNEGKSWKELKEAFKFISKEQLKEYVKRCRKKTSIYTEEI